jgi:hypothetical protein
MAAKDEDGGTLLRGADGELYFIPDDKLAAFKLEEKQTDNARKLIKGAGDLVTVSVLAGPTVRRAGLRAADTTTVSVVSVGAIRRTR